MENVEGEVERVSTRAAGVLRFSEEPDPAALMQLVQLRAIDPEAAYWRRGVEAATRWLHETDSSELRLPLTYVTPEDWSSSPEGVGSRSAPLLCGRNAGSVAVEELERLGMVWSVHASA
ncbi:hypothetical protein ACWKT5_11950 [Streptomyces avermitilis]